MAVEQLLQAAVPGTDRTWTSLDDVGNFGAAPERAAPQPRAAFSAEEDTAILQGIKQYHGPHRFTEIFAAFAHVWKPGRTPAALADHWRQALRKNTLPTIAR